MYKNFNLSQLLAQKALFLLLLFTLGITNIAQAQQLTLWKGVMTYHVDRANDEANDEQNKVTAVFYGDWFVGFFNNSYSRRS